MSLLTQILPKKEPKEYFLTLGVEEYHVRAAACEVLADEITILGTGESDFGDDIDEIEAIDIAISTAEEKLPPDFLVEKTIFALPQIYLEGDNVKAEYLNRLKKIAKTLNLKPHGFIDYPSAISYYLEKEEGAPPTLLLVAVEKKHLTFSLIRVGNNQQYVTIPRTSAILDDFGKVLPEFKSDIFPSRILLFDGPEKLEEIREELLRFPWHKHASFLHMPKIEILPPLAIVTAMVQAAGTSFMKQIDFGKQEEVKAESGPAFGFVKDADIAERSFEEVANLTNPTEPVFIKEETLAQQESFISRFFSKIKLPSFSFSSSPLTSFLTNLVPLLVLGVIVIAAIFSLVWFYPKATLSVIVYPQVATQKIDVAFTTKSTEADPGKNMLAVKEINEEVTGSKTVPVSGKAKVGDRAKGEVTVYNKTLAAKTFPKDTVIKNGSLKFLFDEEIRIASASDTGEGISFGKGNVKISAEAIGPESNLTSGSLFTFADFPETSYMAKNSQNFSGGTSREVSAVSKEDQQKLENLLTEELTGKIRQQLTQKLAPGEIMLDASIEKKVKSKKFTPETGSETKDISLSLTLSLSAYSLAEENLLSLANNSLIQPPAGFSSDKSRTGIRIDEVKTDKKNNLTAKATLTAYFIPIMDTASLKDKLTGKNYRQIEDYLKTVDRVAGFRLTQEMSLPFLSKQTPLNYQNLTVNIVTR